MFVFGSSFPAAAGKSIRHDSRSLGVVPSDPVESVRREDVTQEPVLHLALQKPVPVHGDVRVPEELGPGLLAEPPSGGLGGGRGQPYVDRGSGVLPAQVHLSP
jgi:hypothetical protein